MRAPFMAAVLSLATIGCTTPPVPMAPPLAHTAIDEQGITIAWESFRTALDAINSLRAARVISDGSAKAVRIAGYIDTATDGLNAATAAQRAGNAAGYAAALDEAKAALLATRDLLRTL